MDFKYIMVNDSIRDIPIIFPGMIVHKDMYEYTVRMFKKYKVTIHPVSAGSIRLYPSVYCCGNSETLKLDSRGQEDTDIINYYQYLHGIN